MVRDLSRRRFVEGIAATGIATTLAGCGGGGGDGDDGGGTTDGSGGTTDGGDDGDGTESGADDSMPTFDYTFTDDDSVVGSSLVGISVDYPDGSGALSDASLGGLTLGGGDVSRDVDSTSTSNNGSTMRIDLGGANDIAAGDELVVELSSVSAPSGSYEATVSVNPQSGATEFTESF